jgi:molecular chaperone GrpE
MNIVTDRNEEAVNGEDASQTETDTQTASGAGPDEMSPESEQQNDALAAVQAELARHKEAMLRMQAETDNLRKRLVRELERSRKMALEGVMKDLLAVRDSLERGLEIDPESATVETLLEGQELTLKMLNKVMTDHKLEAIDPDGEAFDPEWHEAMTVLPSPEHEENTVLEVIQKGYRLHDRLIRPARVVVSRKP